MTYRLLFTIIAITGILFGCAKKETTPAPTITESQKLFEEKCRTDYDLHVSTRIVDNTFYIYLPTDQPIFDYEAQQDKSGSAAPEQKISKFNVNYLNGTFKDNIFEFEYDMTDKKKSLIEDSGYTYNYSPSCSKQQNNIFAAVSETFFDSKPAEGERMPEFFVVIITDIVKGIESRSTFYLEDYKRAASGDLPYDEYTKRFLSDTKGGQSFIGDEIGSHINYTPIIFSEFLTKQIVNRIRFKFQQSDFAPSDDYDQDIVNLIADTVRYYDFKDFSQLKLNNLRLDTSLTLTPMDLKEYGEEQTTPKIPGMKDGGKLIHIIFENGKAHFPDENLNDPAESKQK